MVTDDLLGASDADADAPDADADAPDGVSTELDAPTDAPATVDPDGTTDPPTASATRWQRWRERRRNRVSKWDRPPAPKDWRFFVGTLGKILIATGILMFGFVAYQLWGTGIETARAQNSLENAFEQAVAANQADRTDDTVADAASPDETTDTTTDDAAAEVTPITPDGSTLTGGSTPATDTGAGTPSEIVPGAVDLSDDAIEQNVPVVPPGEAIAKLEIPALGIDDLYVVQGVTHDDLKKGPGHYPDTPLPGQLGNASIAGHRTTYGAPFFDLDQLAAGDEVIATVVTGDRFVYRVTGSQVVTADDSWVITTRDPNVAELTLTTCHPKYTARDRLVIHTVLVPELSSQVGVAEFWHTDQTRTVTVPATRPPESADEAPAGDDPTVASSTVATTMAEIESSSEDRPTATFLDGPAAEAEAAAAETPTTVADDATTEATPATSIVADVTPPATTVPGIDLENAEIDAFSEGWFADGAAWPQIALWGLALTAISLLAYQISKKTRHDSIGFLVGIAPFVFALYFFFQNVNRLLPPGL